MSDRSDDLPPYVLALDVATHTGVCQGRAGDDPQFFTIDFSGGSGHPHVFAKALRWIADRLAVSKPDVIYIEAPLRMGASGGQTNADTVLRLFGLYAVFSSAAIVKGIRVVDASVGEIRRPFLGNGTLRGEIAKLRALEMCRAIGWPANTPDEADAGALYWYALSKEAPNLAPLISPMLQHQVAAKTENEAIQKAARRRTRSIEIAEARRRKADKKAAREAEAELLFKRARA